MFDEQFDDDMKAILGDIIFQYTDVSRALVGKSDNEIGLILDQMSNEVDALSVTCAVLEAAADRLKAADPQQTKLSYCAKVGEMVTFLPPQHLAPFKAKVVGLGAFLDKEGNLVKKVKIIGESGDHEWVPELWIEVDYDYEPEPYQPELGDYVRYIHPLYKRIYFGWVIGLGKFLNDTQTEVVECAQIKNDPSGNTILAPVTAVEKFDRGE